ncbi:formylglycine-generating enzyme family protein [bacterium]|nr:formylglycine-generating enzyme family protein [bacterium]
MKTKLLLLLFCLSVLGAMGQGTISRNKCNTCGKAVSQCSYKGKHPKQGPATKPKTTPKPKPKPIPAQRVSATYQNNVLRVGNVSYRMVYVSGGTFTMGATSEMTEPYEWENPTHQVTLSGYSIGETEVTQALWKAVMGSNPSYFKGDDLPVEKMSWNDCQTFIRKLNELTGRHFRLPTEAEWEFAARGGNQSRHTQYSGSSRIDDVAWYYGNSGNKTHPVKTKQPNELGIYDMSGNVWEWCQDRKGSYSSSAQTNPTGAFSGSYRVYRGGSWLNDPRYCRSSHRFSNTPDYEYYYLGLRLVLSE